MAGGAVADDFNNDLYLDLMASTSDPAGQIRYFRNNHNGTFSDRTKEAGLVGMYRGLNILQADYNNDGHLDILVLRGAWNYDTGLHPNSLLRNNGVAERLKDSGEGLDHPGNFYSPTIGLSGAVIFTIGNQPIPQEVMEVRNRGLYANRRPHSVDSGRNVALLQTLGQHEVVFGL